MSKKKSDQMSENYGEMIRELRIKNHLTQAQVAAALDVTPGYISNVENNRTGMSLRILIYYAKLTGQTLDALVGQLDTDYKPASLDNEVLNKVAAFSDEQKMKLIKVLEILQQ